MTTTMQTFFKHRRSNNVKLLGCRADMSPCAFGRLMDRIAATVCDFGSDKLHVELMVNVSHSHEVQSGIA